MRADRLLTILLLLQAHGRLSARALADRLEVSERTVHRDMEALSMAGVPVWAQTGRHGGWSLADDYRTDLTGLTEAELRSLVVAGAPGILGGLGLGEAFDRAITKVLATLPGGASGRGHGQPRLPPCRPDRLASDRGRHARGCRRSTTRSAAADASPSTTSARSSRRS